LHYGFTVFLQFGKFEQPKNLPPMRDNILPLPHFVQVLPSILPGLAALDFLGAAGLDAGFASTGALLRSTGLPPSSGHVFEHAPHL
jgi:hypothetical protein